jgi:hypothetical protein
MFSLCYAYELGYLLHVSFPSPSILQDYIEFDLHTIIRLENLFGVISFGGFVS